MSTPTPSGIVQFFINGDNEQQCKQMFRTVTCLVEKGYKHIGLTYSANYNEQTTKILSTYNYNIKTRKFTGSTDDEKTISDTGISGSGQANVLDQNLDNVVNKAKNTKDDIISSFKKAFRVIPFSTMMNPGGIGDITESVYNTSKDFVEDFLKLPNSIILGWCGDDNLKLLENTSIVTDTYGDKSKEAFIIDLVTDLYGDSANTKIISKKTNSGKSIDIVDRDKHFNVGGVMAERLENVRQTYIPLYLQLLVGKWNKDAQEIVNKCQFEICSNGVIFPFASIDGTPKVFLAKVHPEKIDPKRPNEKWTCFGGEKNFEGKNKDATTMDTAKREAFEEGFRFNNGADQNQLDLQNPKTCETFIWHGHTAYFIIKNIDSTKVRFVKTNENKETVDGKWFSLDELTSQKDTIRFGDAVLHVANKYLIDPAAGVGLGAKLKSTVTSPPPTPAPPATETKAAAETKAAPPAPPPAPVPAPAAPATSTPVTATSSAPVLAPAAATSTPAATSTSTPTLPPATSTPAATSTSTPAPISSAASTSAADAKAAAEAKELRSAPAPIVPHSSDMPQKIVSLEFEKAPWAFYRCLLRGYILTTLIDQYGTAQDDESEKQKVLAQIGRIANGGIKYSVLHSSNVFVFDNIEITECDMIFGMLKRISNWAEYKCRIDAPTRNSDDTNAGVKEDVFSGGDYFIEQLKDFFTEVKKIKPDAPAAKDPIEFIKKITERMHLPGDDVTIPEKVPFTTKVSNAVRSVFSRLQRSSGGKFTRRKGGGPARQKVLAKIGNQIKTTLSAKAGLATGTQLRHLYYKSLNIGKDVEITVDSAFNKIKMINNVEKIKDKPENDSKTDKSEDDSTTLKKTSAVVSPSPPSSDVSVVSSTPNVENVSVESADSKSENQQDSKPKEPLVHEKIKPTYMRYMTVDQYFEKLSIPVQVHVKNEKGVKNNTHIEVVPEVWGHPLILLIPFSRAMLCDIEVYSKPKSGSTPGPGSESSESDSKDLNLVFYVRSDEETRPVIRILIPTASPTDSDFLNDYTKYMANFQLLIDAGIYNQGKAALDQKLERMNAENELNRQLSLLPRFKNMLHQEKLKCKEVDKKIDNIFDEIHDLMQDPNYPNINEELKTKINALSEKYSQEKQTEMNEEKKDEKVTTSTSSSESVDMYPAPPTDDIGRGAFSKLSETAAGVKMKLKKYATDIKNKIRISYTSPEKLAARLTKITEFLNDFQPEKDAHMKKIEEYRKKIVELETLEYKFKKDPTANPVEIMNELQEQENLQPQQQSQSQQQQQPPPPQQEQLNDQNPDNSFSSPASFPRRTRSTGSPQLNVSQQNSALLQSTQNVPQFPQTPPKNVPTSPQKRRQLDLEEKRKVEDLLRENNRLRKKLDKAKDIPTQVKGSSSQSTKRTFKPAGKIWTTKIKPVKLWTTKIKPGKLWATRSLFQT